MDYRNLELTLISAKGIKKSSLFGRPDVYAVAYISGTASNQKLRTHVDKDGGSNPTWNFPMRFTVDEAAGLQNRLTLIVEIKAVGTFSDKNLGEVRVPVKELLEGGSSDGKAQKLVSYQVMKPSGKPKGYVSLSYKIGEKFSGKVEEPVTAYPPGMAVGSSSTGADRYYQPPVAGYPPQPQAGYAYQHQQQPGYGSYPPPPPPGYGGYPPQQGYGYPAVQQPPKKNRLGMGLGAGLLGGALGGLLIGDIVSDAAGGCGGGGCGGGGCGGGGCGGF